MSSKNRKTSLWLKDSSQHSRRIRAFIKQVINKHIISENQITIMILYYRRSLRIKCEGQFIYFLIDFITYVNSIYEAFNLSV